MNGIVGSAIAQLVVLARTRTAARSADRAVNYAALDGDIDVTALLVRFVYEESGQDLIEYGLLVGILTATSTLTIRSLGAIVFGFYDQLQTNMAP